jgi:hypothetical protein
MAQSGAKKESGLDRLNLSIALEKKKMAESSKAFTAMD